MRRACMIFAVLLLAWTAAAIIGRQTSSEREELKQEFFAGRSEQIEAVPVAAGNEQQPLPKRLISDFPGGIIPGAFLSSGFNAVAGADRDAFVYPDRYQSCTVKDAYDEGETTCFVDSVNGNDANDGMSEEFPVRSQSAIDSRCTVVRFKRGSVFNEKLALFNYRNILFGYNVKVYTNYGPQSDPLPHFRVSSEPGRGPVALGFRPITIDGLHLSGARGDNTMYPGLFT